MSSKLYNIFIALFLALTSVVVLASCAADDEELQPGVEPPADGQCPIAFASVAAAQEEVTRATAPLGQDFVVYGYKNVGGTEQLVFNGYTVKYEAGSDNTSVDNTNGYYYVFDEQTIKFWDFGASEYHFWGAYAKEAGRATFSGPRNETLTITDVPLRIGEPAPEDDVLYAAVYDRHPVSAGVVQLHFKRPYSKLRIQFYTSEKIEDESDNIELSKITFGPDPGATSPLVKKIYGKGNVVVTYPSTSASCTGAAQETVTVDQLALPQDNFPFDAVTLTPSLGLTSNNAVTAPIDGSDGFQLGDMPGSSLKASTRAGEMPGRKYYYYPLPMGDKNPAFILNVCINGDTEMKTASVPAVYMQWQPNCSYTYIFKITEAGRKLTFFDVKIDPWEYGGSQNEEWKNW